MMSEHVFVVFVVKPFVYFSFSEQKRLRCRVQINVEGIGGNRWLRLWLHDILVELGDSRLMFC